MELQHVRKVVDLTDPVRNQLLNMSVTEARSRVASGDPQQVREIDGHFALVTQNGVVVRMARSLGVPMRYFIAKRKDGPALVAANRIQAIAEWLGNEKLLDQFHPSYTRMAPAHYITQVDLVGCPDPNPIYHRYFSPRRETQSSDLNTIGRHYAETLAGEILSWLHRIPPTEPVGVCFSGGVDSGAVLLITYHVMLVSGMNPARLKAFTLSVDGGGADLNQARSFLDAVDLQFLHEAVEVRGACIDWEEAVRVLEDYKPLDVQAGAMMMALCRGIRARYPDWTYLLDGDGGDENFKDYPIEENPELTIRSVLNNCMLYQEGWGVDSIKHSLTYSGGLSRGCVRAYAPASMLGFTAFSPHTLPNVIEVAEGIPFIALTDWQHSRLYRLKGEILSRGVEAVTGRKMPVFEKRRFQHGALAASAFAGRFPESPATYRRAFHAQFGP